MFHPRITTMRTFIMWVAVCLIVASLVVTQSYAQENEEPELFLVMEEFVAPSDLPKFWTVQSEALEMFDKLRFDMEVWAYQTDDNSFYWVVPIKNFGSVDEFFAKSMEFSQKLSDVGYDPALEFRDLSSISQFVVCRNKALSYRRSETPGYAEPDKFYEWTFIYLKSGHEKEMADVCRKYIDFYQAIDEDYSWNIYEVVFGGRTPCWIFEVSSENEARLRQLESDLQDKYHDDFVRLWQSLVPHVRTMESKKGWFLPAWSRFSEN